MCHAEVLFAAGVAGIEAIYRGSGSKRENGGSAEEIEAADIGIIGPNPQCIRRMGALCLFFPYTAGLNSASIAYSRHGMLSASHEGGRRARHRISWPRPLRLCADGPLCRTLREAVRHTMTDPLLALILAVALGSYLAFTLLKPERF